MRALIRTGSTPRYSALPNKTKPLAKHAQRYRAQHRYIEHPLPPPPQHTSSNGNSVHFVFALRLQGFAARSKSESQCTHSNTRSACTHMLRASRDIDFFQETSKVRWSVINVFCWMLSVLRLKSPSYFNQRSKKKMR